MNNGGYVYLVGAGPGDLQLMTLKARRCVEMADVVLYDRLVNPLLLEWTKPDCEHIYCGKLPKRHLLRQEAINEKLVQYGTEGKIVVRLKGGDPSVFGRVGEEAHALDEAGVPYEIVPGITAGIGAATYAGIPVTHRNHSASFTVVTGHDKSEKGEPLIDWQALARGSDTIAFYMGVKNLGYIANQLTLHGKPKETPVILIQWGTLGSQKTVSGTLETIAEEVSKSNLTNPAITLVGDVANIRKEPSWFERKPLFGQHILLGRTSGSQGAIAHELEELGAEVFEFPRMYSRTAEKPQADFRDFDQIVFLSPESVEIFFNWLRADKVDLRDIRAAFHVRSKKSERALEKYGCFTSELSKVKDGCSKVLLLGNAHSANDKILLTDTWGPHEYVITHHDLVVSSTDVTCERLKDEGRIQTIVFPSAQSVQTVSDRFMKMGWSIEEINETVKVICFGSMSEKAALSAGYKVDVVLESPTKEALIKALIQSNITEVVK
ncbi:uroporphyrinogen-III C-methyltransferase [Alkalihalophilus pseudofirmus]|uniref:uroporphyrinogen-III C-methyltransferase n=1 Tax=Alkalihalophilus pseudofirmus TaxID=79885 RepID=UPI00259B0C95|nr:uroporphyrinogen-III C-methyltransferase [Alkalihalophilus pseudofirmus]WEG18145.1 uroporphyrinogen-III C-methyltransferase [Alkalihalophilus pseudofirmus]